MTSMFEYDFGHVIKQNHYFDLKNFHNFQALLWRKSIYYKMVNPNKHKANFACQVGQTIKCCQVKDTNL